MPNTILCYGDSNTFGFATVPRPDGRYAAEERWTGVLAANLGVHWRVVEEGLPGRTTVRDDPVEGDFLNGKTYLLPCLLSHRPLDVVAILLGSNDLKARFNASAWDIAQGAGTLVDIARTAGVGRDGRAPDVLVIAPAPVQPMLPSYDNTFAGAYEKSLQFAECYAALAISRSAHFLNAGSVATTSGTDGLHLDPGAHLALGLAVAATTKNIHAR